MTDPAWLVLTGLRAWEITEIPRPGLADRDTCAAGIVGTATGAAR